MTSADEHIRTNTIQVSDLDIQRQLEYPDTLGTTS